MRVHASSTRDPRRGAALVLALIAVMVVAMMSLGVVQLTSGLARQQGVAGDLKRSFYLAEAGLAEAYVGLMDAKSGQVGTREAPAAYGDGLFWVDSTDEPDGSIRLESTGMCGRGQVKLGLVVRWTGEGIAALGFFADGDLVVQPGSLVDGYLSSEGTYEEQAKKSKAPGWSLYGDGGGQIGSNGDITLLSEDPESLPVDVLYGTDAGKSKGKDKSKELDKIREKRGRKDRPEDKKDKTYSDSGEIIDRGRQRQEDGFKGNSRNRRGRGAPDDDLLGVKLGDKSVLKDGGTAVFAEVALQEANRLDVHPGTYVDGELSSLSDPHELPPIELPDLSMLPGVDHADSGPLVLPAGAYEGLRVRADARVVLEGPNTLVLGEVIVDSGGELVFDTTGGAVVIYVTEQLEFAAGSMVSYTEARTDRVEIQVAAIEGEDEDPKVRIETSDPLYGLVYAPQASVLLDDRSEFFGAIVAADLALGRDVRLHFDRSLTESRASDSMPMLRGWEIVDLGALGGGGVTDPFRHLGVDRNALRMPKDAHMDLWIEVKYLSSRGIEFDFAGWESTFDWSNVGEVLKMTSRRGPDDPVIEELKGKDGWLEVKLK